MKNEKFSIRLNLETPIETRDLGIIEQMNALMSMIKNMADELPQVIKELFIVLAAEMINTDMLKDFSETQRGLYLLVKHFILVNEKPISQEQFEMISPKQILEILKKIVEALEKPENEADAFKKEMQATLEKHKEETKG